MYVDVINQSPRKLILDTKELKQKKHLPIM